MNDETPPTLPKALHIAPGWLFARGMLVGAISIVLAFFTFGLSVLGALILSVLKSSKPRERMFAAGIACAYGMALLLFGVCVALK